MIKSKKLWRISTKKMALRKACRTLTLDLNKINKCLADCSQVKMKLVLLQFTVVKKTNCVITITPIRTKFVAFFFQTPNLKPHLNLRTNTKNCHHVIWLFCYFLSFCAHCTLPAFRCNWNESAHFFSVFRQFEYECTQFMKWKWCGNEICMWQCNCKKKRAGEKKKICCEYYSLNNVIWNFLFSSVWLDCDAMFRAKTIPKSGQSQAKVNVDKIPYELIHRYRWNYSLCTISKFWMKCDLDSECSAEELNKRHELTTL